MEKNLAVAGKCLMRNGQAAGDFNFVNVPVMKKASEMQISADDRHLTGAVFSHDSDEGSLGKVLPAVRPGFCTPEGGHRFCFPFA